MSHGLVPAGSVIKRTYYAVPDHYTIGTEFPTFLAAARAALTKRDETAAAIAARYPAGWTYGGTPEEIGRKTAKVGCVVDLRWVIAFPAGGGTDTMIERTNVDHLTFEHIDRMEALPQASLA